MIATSSETIFTSPPLSMWPYTARFSLLSVAALTVISPQGHGDVLDEADAHPRHGHRDEGLFEQ